MKEILVALLFLFPVSIAQQGEDVTAEIIAEVNEEMVSHFIRSLQDFGPRVTSSEECHLAGDYIYGEFKNMGYETHFLEWNMSGYEDRNVEAILHGERDDSIIVCAHYDSVPGSPGADDDGSGVAGVLSCAKAISEYLDEVEMSYTVRFVTFSGEEEGLLGSYSYASYAYETGMNIVAVLNMDMIGYVRSEAHKVRVFEDENSKWITDIAEEQAGKYGINLSVVRHGASASSDHWPFMLYGYDAVFFHEYDFNDYYHSSQDTIDKMDIGYATRVVKLVLATLLQISKIEEIDKEPPHMEIVKPLNGLYIWDERILPLERTIIIGKISVVVNASDNVGVERVEFYIDDVLKEKVYGKPYQWLWDETVVGKHEIEVLTYDLAGNCVNESVEVFILNI